jgi:hypothetical protein
MEDLSNQDIIRALRLKAEKHERIAKSFREAIENLESINKPEPNQVKVSAKIKRTKLPKRIHYENQIISILSDGMPRTTRELYNELINRLQRNIIFSTFSGRLSVIVKEKGNIKKHEFPSKPLSKRYYYGLKEWFDMDRLKNEYLDKIIDEFTKKIRPEVDVPRGV